MPNPLRTLANGGPLWTSWVDVWQDDVSGNWSKQWNVHNNTCITHANLPWRLLQSEYYICFVGTSQHASPIEQATAVQEMIKYAPSVSQHPTLTIISLRSTQQAPVAVVDPVTQEHAHMCLFQLDSLNDTPMGSIICSHIGSNGSCDCWKCDRGGPFDDIITDKGYSQLFEVALVCSLLSVHFLTFHADQPLAKCRQYASLFEGSG
jgi:hypothetical protein